MKSIPVREIQATQINPDNKKEFNIRRFEELQAGKGMKQSVHRHDFFYLLAIEKGEGSHNIDFQDYEITDNSVFFMRPGQVHEHEFKAGGKGFLLVFQPEFYPYHKDLGQKTTLRQIGRSNCYELNLDNYNSIKLILESIYSEFENQSKNFESIIRSYLNILITTINRINISENSTREISYDSERLDELLELIEDNISTTKKVTDYADKMNLSSYQLNTITKKMLGKTCSDLISEQVILEAKRLLLSTSNQIYEIAFQLGFDDPAYFIRFFKKHNEVSPQAFRNNFK